VSESSGAVEHPESGLPSHEQEVGSLTYWYYMDGQTTEYQLVIEGEIVRSINRYN
jgi:hypothetical protein